MTSSEKSQVPVQEVLFHPRFIEQHVGNQLLNDVRTALTELIANCWDAGATEVRVLWPTPDDASLIAVGDNGHGLTKEEFLVRWRTLAYDRRESQGSFAQFPPDRALPPRRAFGRNGVGRFAAFCFGDEYEVSSKRDGLRFVYRVTKGGTVPLELHFLEQEETAGHGTEVIIRNLVRAIPEPDAIRAEIALRFLTDPNFGIWLNDERIEFSHVPEDQLERAHIEVEGYGDVELLVLSVSESDRTTRQHGVAWHVNGRLVGECSWKGFAEQAFIDGRTAEAKSFTFIARAEFLLDSVRPDWSGFKDDDAAFGAANAVVSRWIRNRLLEESKEKRQETVNRVAESFSDSLRRMTPLSRERWMGFVQQVQTECPNIREREVHQLAGLLANLELSQGKYRLIESLHQLTPGHLDDLTEILDSWTVSTAKEVLGELEIRLRLLEELKSKVFDESADEVQELQPLFERGLWIFGPEYETIEFTSNEGMTKVIQNLLGREETGSRRRPDFAVLPDGSVGLYTYPEYDDEGAEVGVSKLTIVELKRAGVSLGAAEKDQCWKYIKELLEKGHLTAKSQVTAFVLGSKIERYEESVDKKRNGQVKIRPLVYQAVIDRAKSRLLKLYDRVKAAPFLKAHRDAINGVGTTVSGQLELNAAENLGPDKRLKPAAEGAAAEPLR